MKSPVQETQYNFSLEELQSFIIKREQASGQFTLQNSLLPSKKAGEKVAGKLGI